MTEGEDCRRRAGQVHEIECRKPRINPGKQYGNDSEIFCNIVGDRERRQRASRHQELFTDSDDVDELCRAGIEIDHVARFFRGLRAGVHGYRHIRLSECGSVVSAGRPSWRRGDLPPAIS